MSNYKYLQFSEFISANQKNRKWVIEDKQTGAPFGWVRWHPEWQQYCFWGVDSAAYGLEHLDEIGRFIRDDPKRLEPFGTSGV